MKSINKVSKTKGGKKESPPEYDDKTTEIRYSNEPGSGKRKNPETQCLVEKIIRMFQKPDFVKGL